ncbi:DUF3288 family protein [Thermosynechococcaceae cyanobacterium BACA0444]|uniref:DUF3288 family protein n=1 Tax=Pseudocalidococcus azoricus BACA0444 TaxID=2918990 RepID=A0AAE4JYF9_9CYAN|nr:DUF3288 family protein [Pseudocalidococcus azoricus]MDS3860954.1 DUF3288 family protein [Pseudocalidococcus azoricus BACA0444]
MSVTSQKIQQHPQASQDRAISQRLLTEEPTDLNLVELARLRIRYQGFPGAADIKADLDQALARWQLSELELFARTRQLHQQGGLYKPRSSKKDDWT